jgi:hypothetical protein
MIECLTVQVLQCIAQQPVEQYTIRQRGGGGGGSHCGYSSAFQPIN